MEEDMEAILETRAARNTGKTKKKATIALAGVQSVARPEELLVQQESSTIVEEHMAEEDSKLAAASNNGRTKKKLSAAAIRATSAKRKLPVGNKTKEVKKRKQRLGQETAEPIKRPKKDHNEQNSAVVVEKKPPKLSKADEAWSKKYQELEAYKYANGDCLVPKRYADNPSLGGWVVTQRKHYKKNKLPKDRVEKLHILGFAFPPTNGETALASNTFNYRTAKLEELWDQRYQELQSFIAKKGDCFVPAVYTENSPLGAWVANQRKFYRINQLRKDRMEKLNEIQFVWDVQGAKKNKDKQKKAALVPAETLEGKSTAQNEKVEKPPNPPKLTKKKKAVPVEKGNKKKEEPTAKLEKNTAAAQQKQKDVSKKPKSADDTPKAAKEKKTISREEKWNQMYEELKAFAAENGHCNPPRRNKEKPTALASWVATQRGLYKKKELKKERIAKLQTLDFLWDAKTAQKDTEELWKQRYEELKAYTAAHGNALVSQYNKEYPKLGHWVRNQRRYYKQQLLRKDRIRLLEEVKFVWKVVSEKDGIDEQKDEPGNAHESLQAGNHVPGEDTAAPLTETRMPASNVALAEQIVSV